MSPIQYFFYLLRELKVLAKEVGYSTLQMYIAFTRCYILKHVEFEEFKVLHLYRYTCAELKTFLVAHQNKKIKRALNSKKSAQASNRKDDQYGKNSINHRLGNLVKRDWMYMPDHSEDEIRQFISNHKKCIAKPTDKSQGEGITVFTPESTDAETFISLHKKDKYILEDFITQHPAMADLNPTSVNTIRIVTARKNERIYFVGAALRCGGENAVVDNFHCGGVGFPLDLETGIVCAPGKNLSNIHARQLVSPATGHIVVGFQVPHWDELIRTVKEAASVLEELGYLAWDIAITPSGVDIVEVNLSFPGASIIQLNDIGVYSGLKAFMAS